jgi:MFS family permease
LNIGPKKRETLWNFNYIYLLILSALTSTAFQMISPVVSKFAVTLGAGLTIAGAITGVFSITALVVRPFSGVIADRFNKKWIMVCSTIVIAFSVLCYSFAGSVTALLAFRVVHGIAFALSGTTNMAFASTFIPKDRMGEGIGYLGLGHILSTAIGPSLGLWAINRFGYNWCFYLSFFIALFAAVLMLFIDYKPEIRTENTDASTGKKVRFNIKFSDLVEVKLLPYAVFGGLFSLANGLVSSFIAIMGDERGIANVGIFFTVNAIVLLAIRPFGGKLNDKKGLSFVLIPAYIAAAASMAMLAGARSTWMIALAGVLKAIGQGAGQPAIQAECIRMLPDKRGVATSTYYIGADVGQGLGPVIGGAVSTGLGFNAMYGGACGILLLAMFAFIVYRNHARGKKAQ